MAFVGDAQTETLLTSCLSHFSFSDAIIRRGGIAGAIRYLSAARSPETIIVDISGIEMPASRVRDVVEVCEPGVTVIAIGDRNDVGLYRDLVHSGVGEYIVKPVTAQLLANAILRSHRAGGGSSSRKLGKLIAIVGARGGVGATTLAIQLASHLANRQNRRVILLDLDLHTGDCALALNLKPTPGLREALANPRRIDSVFIERTVVVHGERLFVLSAQEPLRADAEFTAEAVTTLLGVLRTQFHYIIADIPRIPTAPYHQALSIADTRVIVADQSLRSVRDTVRLRDALGERAGMRRIFLVVNRSGESGAGAMTLEEMATVKLNPDFLIPFRRRCFTAPGVPARGAFGDAVSAMAAEISGRAPERKRWWRCW